MISKTSKIRRIEDLKGAIIGVLQYGSEADTFARLALAKAGLKPEKETTIIQLGGHPQVAASLAAGASFFRDIEKSGLIEQLYKGRIGDKDKQFRVFANVIEVRSYRDRAGVGRIREQK